MNVQVQVSGNGNLKLFDLPGLEVPSSLEQYEPERSENVKTDLRGTQGSITDNYTIVPTQKGKFPIPALSFSYFDLKSKSYKTINSDEILLDVKSAPAGSNYTPGSGNSVAKQTVEAGEQFRYIKLNTNLKSINSGAFLGSTLFWALLLSPGIFILLAIFLGKKKEAIAGDVAGNKRKKANKLARKYLSEAKKNLGDQKTFYIALERALHNYLKAKLHIQTSDMSKDRVMELLQERNADPETRTEFISLLTSCEFARYTPSSNVAMEQDYEKAAKVISALDKQI